MVLVGAASASAHGTPSAATSTITASPDATLLSGPSGTDGDHSSSNDTVKVTNGDRCRQTQSRSHWSPPLSGWCVAQRARTPKARCHSTSRPHPTTTPRVGRSRDKSRMTQSLLIGWFGATHVVKWRSIPVAVSAPSFEAGGRSQFTSGARPRIDDVDVTGFDMPAQDTVRAEKIGVYASLHKSETLTKALRALTEPPLLLLYSCCITHDPQPSSSLPPEHADPPWNASAMMKNPKQASRSEQTNSRSWNSHQGGPSGLVRPNQRRSTCLPSEGGSI